MKNKPIQKDRNSAMFRKSRALTGLLGDVDCLSQRLLKQMVGFHYYLLGESIPQDQCEGDKPGPEGMLDYWIGDLQKIIPRLKSIEEHFDNLGYIAK